MKKEGDNVDAYETSNGSMMYRASPFDKFSNELDRVVEDAVMEYIVDWKEDGE